MLGLWVFYASYLGTMESPPLRVVGSSSNMEEMSMPSGTGTSVYMTFSWGARRRPLKASLSASSCRKGQMERQPAAKQI